MWQSSQGDCLPLCFFLTPLSRLLCIRPASLPVAVVSLCRCVCRRRRVSLCRGVVSLRRLVVVSRCRLVAVGACRCVALCRVSPSANLALIVGGGSLAFFNPTSKQEELAFGSYGLDGILPLFWWVPKAMGCRYAYDSNDRRPSLSYAL